MGVDLVELDVTRRPDTRRAGPRELPTIPVPGHHTVPGRTTAREPRRSTPRRAVPRRPVPRRPVRRRRTRATSIDVPLTVLACVGALVAVGLGRPGLETLAAQAGAAPPAADVLDLPAGSTPPTPSAPPAGSVAVGAPLVPPTALPGLVAGTGAPGRTVALTFDDGPDPEWTPRVLDLLARYRVHATFCIVGEQADAHPGLVTRIRTEGHQLCDHTRTHDAHLAHAPSDRIRDEVLGGRDHVLAAAGPGAVVPYFRAPEGAWSPAVLASTAAGGMTPLAWSVDTLDWTRPGVDAVLAAVRRELRPGGVILMHDGGGPRSQSVQALAVLLGWLRDQGWAVVPPAPVTPPDDRR